MSTAFQAVYKTKEYTCFEIKLYKLTSSSGITLIFLVKAGKGYFIMAMTITRKNPFLPIETIALVNN